MPRALGALLFFLAAAPALSCCSGCSRVQGPPSPSTASAPVGPRVELRPEGRPLTVVQVELARTPQEQQKGLMYRERLDDGRGMLFLFDHPHGLSFWMHNTYIPLDMIFIGADRRVVGVVENATPLTDEPRAVEGISQFVLEVPGGFSAAHRIGPGTPAKFVDVDKEQNP